MTWWTLGMGISGSLVATAIAFWIVESDHIHALVIGGTGVVVFILTPLFTKKPSSTPPSVHQENRQEVNVNPQQHVYIGFPEQDHSEEKNLRHEQLIVDILKPYREPNRSIPQFRDSIVEAAKKVDPTITEVQVVSALERLRIKELVIRRPIEEADGGFMYWLS
jgi:hypothetical protein